MMKLLNYFLSQVRTRRHTHLSQQLLNWLDEIVKNTSHV